MPIESVLNGGLQGVLVTLCVWAATGATGLRPMVRHALWCGTLVALLALLLAPMLATAPERDAAPAAVTASAAAAVVLPATLATWSWLFGVIWACGAGVLLIRTAAACARVYAIKRRTTGFPPSRLAALDGWGGVASRGRTAVLRVSADLHVPCVVGLGRAMIVLPHAMLADLTDCELNQVILHEQAHIARRDDWLALGQTCVQAMLWPHPAVWYVAQQIEKTREAACDDTVVALTGDVKAYARCLTRLAELMPTRRSVLLPAGGHSSRELTRRVERLFERRNGSRDLLRVAVAVVAVAASARAAVAVAPFGLAAATHVADAFLVSTPLVAWLHSPMPPGSGASTSSRGPDDSSEAPPQTLRLRLARPHFLGPRYARASRLGENLTQLVQVPEIRTASGSGAARAARGRSAPAPRADQAGSRAGVDGGELERSHILSAMPMAAARPVLSGDFVEGAARAPLAARALRVAVVEGASTSANVESPSVVHNKYVAFGASFGRAGKRTAGFFSRAGASVGRAFSTR